MKHSVSLLFTDMVKPGEDSKPLKRILRMIRSERFPLIRERSERIPGKVVILPNTPQELPEKQEIDLGNEEERLFLVFEMSDPKRLHALVGLLRAYADYCGIYNRVWSWEVL